MHQPPGTAARPAAYTALLLTLSVLVALLLPVVPGGAAGVAGAADGPAKPAASTASTETAASQPSDVDPAVRAKVDGDAEPRTANSGTKDKAAGERAARLKASTAKALARAEAAGAPAPADCAPLALSSFGDPGAAVGKVTLPGDGDACFTFTAERTGIHLVQLATPGATGLGYARIHDGETPLECGDRGGCDLPRTGAFTLRVFNTSWEPREYHTSVVPVGAGTPGCLPAVGTSLNAPPIIDSSPSPLAVVCRPFTAQQGERIIHELKSERYGSSWAWITDDSGADICARASDGNQGCVLPGTGPYRLLGGVTSSEGGFPASYRTRIHRLSQPEGCQTVSVNQYGSAPTASTPGVGCKTFTAPATSSYNAYGVSDGWRTAQRIYDSAGATVCEGYRQPCDLTAGAVYTLHTDAATLVLDRNSTAGCEAVAPGTHRGTLATGGIHCLTLPFPENASVALHQSYGAGAARIETTLTDADGGYVCDSYAQRQGICKLVGKAPFRVLVNAEDGESDSAYALSLVRTDDAAGCRTLPLGDFTAGSAHAALTTGGGSFTDCLSIPAAGQNRSELLQLKALTGAGRADVYVIGADGKLACSVERAYGGTWTGCDFRADTAYTVLLAGVDEPSTFTLTRRDVSGGAKGCGPAPATAVGGASTGGTPADRGSVVCRQVTTGSAGDVLHLNVRDKDDALQHTVFRADGTVVDCGWKRACAITGSTAYQVVISVTAGRYPQPTAYRLDALRIGNGSKPAPECAKVPNISYGFGPVTGVLNEQRTAYCAALPTAFGNRFQMDLTDTAGGSAIAEPALYSGNLSEGCRLFIPSGYQCSVRSGAHQQPEPSTLVLGLPEEASTTSYRLNMVCSGPGLCGPEKKTATGVTPATGVAKSVVTLTVAGSALHEKDKVRISSGGSRIESTTVSVAPDRRTLTARLDLTAAAPGGWDMSVITIDGYERPVGSFTVTPAALKNTKAPAVGGSAKVGAKLTAQPGTWTPAATSYGYQWKADGKDIAKATASTYTVPASLLGKKLSVAVVAKRSGHPSGTATSAAVTVAKGSAPKATKVPTISGTAKVGKKLTANPGTWTPAATSYGYQWYADGRAISGATKSTLDLKTAQRGKKITVKVTAKRTGHADGSAVSKATPGVAR
ncbi:cell surface protein [Streptomyces yaizuensis]|uniref:Cell envelope integrity protein TolA n=1 Tax=Streptomyces yaizuensis TaxID=2989713 RepID=A0ABQ5P005_9ACTN|nr:cell surface protein [Streptomyces sp. YSPA8]GLF95827.1 cell envelope integrity protein TolA [Streptomyces sp. YSPA8]